MENNSKNCVDANTQTLKCLCADGNFNLFDEIKKFNDFVKNLHESNGESAKYSDDLHEEQS